MPEDLTAQGPMPESEDHRQALLDFVATKSSVIYFVAAADEAGLVSYVTPNVKAITGHSPTAILENPEFLRAHLHPEDRGTFRRHKAQAIAKGFAKDTFRIAGASGRYSRFRSEMSCREGPDGAGELIGALVEIGDREDTRMREILEDAIEALSEGLIIYDADDRMIMCNSRYKAFQGDSADLFVPGVRWRDVARARAERGHFLNAIGRVEEWLDSLAARRDATREEAFPAAGGRWYENSHIRTRQGGIVATWRDITERRAMEQELTLRERQFRIIVEGHPIPVWLVDMETAEVLYESPAAAELFGRAWPSESVHYSTDHIDEPAARDEVNARLRAEGEVRDYHCLFRRADGTRFWASVNDRRIDYGGREVSITSFIDLTSQKQREAELRQAREVLEDAIESLPEGFALFAADDRLIMCNARFREFNAASADHLVPGVRWQEFVRAGAERGQYLEAAEDPEAWLEERYRFHSLGKGDGRGVEFQQSDGRWYYAFSQVTRQGGYVAIRVDVTEQKKAQEELNLQREMLHQSEKLSALGELLAGISHELNNPLSVLVGQALMLREEGADPRTAERAQKISDAADRCARIVRTFLALARETPARSLPVDLAAEIEKALEMTAYALRTSGVEVSLSAAPDLPKVLADPDQVQQVFTNLIINAQQALQETEGPRKLRVTLERRTGGPGDSPRGKPGGGRQVVIEFRDNGPGVPEPIRRRIFEPLYSTKGASSRGMSAGTGIGLALCHRIIESHGGSITLESRPGQGATFVIRLPCEENNDVSPQAPEAPPETQDRNSEVYRVLVVDDEYDVGQIISDVLQFRGHEVEVANSGALALERIEAGDYDVILSDIRMPEMDGPTFYRQLQEIKPNHVEALAFITGDTLSPWVKQFLDESKRPFVEKPILPKDIRALVEQIVRARRAGG